MAAKAKRRKTRSHSSDTACAVPSDESRVSIRKIDNGYLVERSGTRAGKYFSRTVYSKTDPLRAGKVTKEVGGRA